jgi:hypothetical protein
MGIKKSVEIASAKKRRAKLLKEFRRLQQTKAGCSKQRLADIHGVSRARICQLLKMAELEEALRSPVEQKAERT